MITSKVTYYWRISVSIAFCFFFSASITAGSNPDQKFHETYFVQVHNTYLHGASLTSWLNKGVRAIELDVKIDGNSHADGPLIDHSASTSDRRISDKNCSNPEQDRLGDCLRDILSWLEKPNNSGPIVLLIDLKMKSGDHLPEAIQDLDIMIRKTLGNTQYSTGDLYKYVIGRRYPESQLTLRRAVSSRGWPSLRELQKKVIVGYTSGVKGPLGFFNEENQTQALALQRMLERGRLPFGFFCPDVEGQPEEIAPGGKVDGFSRSLSQYIVCSNLQITDHYHLTANAAHKYKQLIHLWDENDFKNSSYEYNYLAVAHGVSIIGRDSQFTTRFRNIPLVGQRSAVPGFFQMKASNGRCIEMQDHRNGGTVSLETCNNSGRQRFLYTIEGQLRSQSGQKYCLDIDGGKALASKRIHQWDCDGGESEKWLITPQGNFKSFSNKRYCLTSEGNRLETERCRSDRKQRFEVVPTSQWQQTSF